MPIQNAADSMIRAFQMGLMERRAEEDQAAEQERKKIEMDLLKHRIQQMKLEERIQAWDMNVKGAEAQAKSYEGLPEAEMAKAGMLEGVPARDLSQVVAPITAPGMAAQRVVQPPVAPVAANQQLPVKPIMTPAFVDPATGRNVPAIQLRPRTEEQLAQDARKAAELKASTTPQKLGYGEKLYMGGRVIAENTTQDPADIETKRWHDIQAGIDRMREERLGREGKDYITAAIAQKAAQDLYTNLDAIEEAFAPDPKDIAQYQRDLYAWDNPTAEELKARKSGDKPPQPPRYRMTEAQLDAKKLTALNSYRAQMHMKPATTLPPEFQYKKSAPPPAPDAAPGAPAAAPTPTAAAAPAPAPAIIVQTPQGPFRFTDPEKARAFAKAVGLPDPSRSTGRRSSTTPSEKTSRGSIQ